MPVDRDVAKQLRALDGSWKGAEPQSFATVPDGDYVAKIKSMEVATSKGGRLQVVSVFEIADGKAKGRDIRRFDGIDNEISMGWFKGYCETLGIEIPEHLEDLPNELEAFVGENRELVNIRVKTKDEFTNVYLNGFSDYKVDDEEESEAKSTNGRKHTKAVIEEEEEAEEEEEEEEQPRSKAKKNQDKARRR